jgi:hypothetical protein
MTIGELDLAGGRQIMESGRKIKISKKNPKKDPNGYDQVRF